MIKALCLGALAAGCALPAVAATAQASFDLSKLTFTLFDALPGDGLLPSADLTQLNSDHLDAGPGALGAATITGVPGGVLGQTFGPDALFGKEDTFGFNLTSLGPGTGLTISLPAATAVSFGAGETALASVGIKVWAGGSEQSDGFGVPAGGSLSFARLLSVTVDNLSSAPVSLDWQFNSTIFGQSAPVPEPHTWALMLAGLGVVGWAARRRAR